MWAGEEDPIPTVNAAALAAAPRRKRRRRRSTQHSEVSDNVLLPLKRPGCNEGERLGKTIKVSEMETQFTCNVNSVTPPCTSSRSVFSGASEEAAFSMPLTANVEGVNLVPTLCFDKKAKISDVGHAILGEDTLPAPNCETDTAKPAIDCPVLGIKPSDVLLNPGIMYEQAEGGISETECANDSAHPEHPSSAERASFKTATASGALFKTVSQPLLSVNYKLSEKASDLTSSKTVLPLASTPLSESVFLVPKSNNKCSVCITRPAREEMSSVAHENVCYDPVLIGPHVAHPADGLTRVSALEPDISDCFSTPVHRHGTIIMGLPGFPMSVDDIATSANTKLKDCLSYAPALSNDKAEFCVSKTVGGERHASHYKPASPLTAPLGQDLLTAVNELADLKTIQPDCSEPVHYVFCAKVAVAFPDLSPASDLQIEAVVTQPAPELVPTTRVRAAVGQPYPAPASTPQVGMVAVRFVPTPRLVPKVMPVSTQLSSTPSLGTRLQPLLLCRPRLVLQLCCRRPSHVLPLGIAGHFPGRQLDIIAIGGGLLNCTATASRMDGLLMGDGVAC
ncbi:uncharacterized protein LOC113018126 [Astatotilapia calliptera]|uniref:uncharacterized protein LOC113018126 n=1 Tax=Astatotilapia calliptera TaxID=8154 RepID=UPI000E429582|nr:uncharacterized protein LOC113018126 [Astatotilapia calliptera]